MLGWGQRGLQGAPGSRAEHLESAEIGYRVGSTLILLSLSGRYVWQYRCTGWNLAVPPYTRSLAAPLGGHCTSLSFTRGW